MLKTKDLVDAPLPTWSEVLTTLFLPISCNVPTSSFLIYLHGWKNFNRELNHVESSLNRSAEFNCQIGENQGDVRSVRKLNNTVPES
jgi:hypothetical protein